MSLIELERGLPKSNPIAGRWITTDYTGRVRKLLPVARGDAGLDPFVNLRHCVGAASVRVGRHLVRHRRRDGILNPLSVSFLVLFGHVQISDSAPRRLKCVRGGAVLPGSLKGDAQQSVDVGTPLGPRLR